MSDLQHILKCASWFPNETWDDEFFLRTLEIQEDAGYFAEEICMELPCNSNYQNSIIYQLLGFYF